MEQLYEQGTNILKDHSLVVDILAHSFKRYTIVLNHPVGVSVFSLTKYAIKINLQKRAETSVFEMMHIWEKGQRQRTDDT